MLQADRITCQRGLRILFRDVSVSTSAGDVLRVHGRNGSGKSSLLRILCGLSLPTAGEVRWQGKTLRTLREAFWRNVIYIGHAAGLKDDLLAWENLAIMAKMAGSKVNRQHAVAALERFGVAGIATMPVRVLSQGQRRRVALARLSLKLSAPLWILDEPAASLDAPAVNILCEVLNAHLAQGGIVVHATHQDMPMAAGRQLRIDLGQASQC